MPTTVPCPACGADSPVTDADCSKCGGDLGKAKASLYAIRDPENITFIGNEVTIYFRKRAAWAAFFLLIPLVIGSWFMRGIIIEQRGIVGHIWWWLMLSGWIVLTMLLIRSGLSSVPALIIRPEGISAPASLTGTIPWDDIDDIVIEKRPFVFMTEFEFVILKFTGKRTLRWKSYLDFKLLPYVMPPDRYEIRTMDVWPIDAISLAPLIRDWRERWGENAAAPAVRATMPYAPSPITSSFTHKLAYCTVGVIMLVCLGMIAFAAHKIVANKGSSSTTAIESEERIQALRRRAKTGDANAAADLCINYVPSERPSLVGAYKWCRQAAESGHFRPAYIIGEMYDTGREALQSSIDAYKWLTISLEFAPDEQKRDIAIYMSRIASKMLDSEIWEARSRAAMFLDNLRTQPQK